MIKLYLYHKNIHKATENHRSELMAIRSGQNWALLNRDNTYRIENDERMENIEYNIHMKNLFGGFI